MRATGALAGAIILGVAGLGGMAAADARAGQNPVQEALRTRAASLRATADPMIAGSRIRFPLAVADLYEESGWRPLWNRGAAVALPAALKDLGSDGLRPEGYHLHAVAAPPPGAAESDRLADLEIVRTDALLLAVHDLRFGRARRPARSTARSAEELTGLSARDLREIMGRAALPARLDRLRPGHFLYEGLRAGLAELAAIHHAGGWDSLAAGPAMRAEQHDLRVPALRRRLQAQGYLAGAAVTDDTVFDASMEAGVRAFQRDHGLTEDGVVGPTTRAALNVGVEDRMDQVRVNLERARWVLRDPPDTALLVNVAGASVALLHGSRVVFAARAIVGATETPTPVFTAILRTVELNPPWHVPPGIVAEVLAAARRSRTYLSRESIRVLDPSGRIVDPATIDFGRYSAATFPYSFRQEPGPRNPLGRVKFGLPNPHNVYLHDTPAPDLFARQARTFSHGCVRVEDPVGLAELVLGDSAWSRAAIEAAIVTGGTRVIPLQRPLPVLVHYWTASVDSDGQLHFHADLYSMDAALLAELDRP